MNEDQMTFDEAYAELHLRHMKALLEGNSSPEKEAQMHKYVDQFMQRSIDAANHEMDIDLKERELDLKEREISLKEKESKERKKKEKKDRKLKKRELELKERELKVDQIKCIAGIVGDVVGVAELAGSIYAAKDFYMEDFKLQNDGFMPDQLGKEGKMLIDSNLRNNLPR